MTKENKNRREILKKSLKNQFRRNFTIRTLHKRNDLLDFSGEAPYCAIPHPFEAILCPQINILAQINKLSGTLEKSCKIDSLECTVCRLRFKKNFKYFNRDPHRIVSYGLNVENKHSFKSQIEGQFFENSMPGFEPGTLKITTGGHPSKY